MIVASFYRFAPLQDVDAWRRRLEARAAELGLKGTILLAAEGINGALCGARNSLRALVDELRLEAPFRALSVRYSAAQPDTPVFGRLKVRVKPEIVTFGQPHCNPAQWAGTPVDATGWNALLDHPETTVIDVRNHYETALGGFPGSLDPGTDSFSEFTDFVRNELDPAKHSRTALYCTGGIRCEKASAYLLQAGFESVHQLNGGILAYLATVPQGESRWRGQCFVFDGRLAIDDRLRQV